MAPAYKWTPEIEEELLDRIAKGEAIRNICKDEFQPSWATVQKRLSEDEAFAARYARAREAQGDGHFDRVCAIVDKVESGTLDPQQARIMIDALKWTAGKLRPKVYGDKLDVNHKGGITINLDRDAEDL